MASDPSLAQVEERLVGHLRRLCRTSRDFKLEIFGTFKSGHRIVELRPCPYERFDTDQLEAVFQAID